MTMDAIEDYLTKELYIERNVVTYRSLSRAQRIHVNVAKNELANYLKNGSQKAFATYLISGVPKEQDDAMNVDTEGEPNLEYSGGDSNVPQSRIVIVGDSGLQNAKAQFARINTVHVYSLSPSAILDSGHLCTPTVDVVRPIDKQQGPEFAAVVGRVVGKHVSTKPVKRHPQDSIAGPSKIRPKPLPVPHAQPREKTEIKSEQPEEKPKQKPKATGKLDFSKAKVKVKEEVKAEPQKEKAASSSKEKQKKLKTEVEEKPRGTKRKSTAALMSESEGEKEKPKKEKEKATTKSSKGKAPALVSESETEPRSTKPTRPGRTQKKAVLSSDDDDDDGPRIHRRQSKVLAKLNGKLEEHMDKEMQDMMDVDDDQVIRHRRLGHEALKKEEEEEEEKEEEEEEVRPDPVKEDEDVDMEDPAPKKKRATRAKKVVPVGRNGLKKKRVVRARMKTEGGIMAMEDYSEYESVDEEEPEPPKKTKAKAKSKAKATTASKKDSEDSDTATGPSKPAAASKKVATDDNDSATGPSKSKPANKKSSTTTKTAKGNTKTGQKGNIASFFGKAPSK